jgi:deoxyribodipyrimidine photo-lyase
MFKTPLAVMWFRRDLRLHDNAALYHALRSGLPVLPVFMFDRHILDALSARADRRVQFIYEALQHMQTQLVAIGSSLYVRYGHPNALWMTLLEQYDVKLVFTNHDYEPYAQIRDGEVGSLLAERGIGFTTIKDQVIFEKDEVLKDDGQPYTVFTPYSRRWRANLKPNTFNPFPTEKSFNAFHTQPAMAMPSLHEMGFEATNNGGFPPSKVEADLLACYADRRNFPGIAGTSKLGVHLRFGTVSIRQVARMAAPLSDTFLSELIWRDFYHMVLHHFPRVGQGKAFKPAYDNIEWRNNEAEFTAWRHGQTGYPIVDAGMRELSATGFMHNRVRMITASFLIKHLLIDWRWGEAYFAEKLLDFDLAANNGGWQWAASSGCDAAPYFRVFNPTLQMQKFDPNLAYVRRWVPEFDSLQYPQPIVNHEFARARVLAAYKAAL